MPDQETPPPKGIEHPLCIFTRDPGRVRDIRTHSGAELANDFPRSALIDIDDPDEPRLSIGVLRDEGELMALEHDLDGVHVRFADAAKKKIDLAPRRIDAHVLE